MTTHKLLEFVNKRTNRDVVFRYTDETIQLYLKYFIAASAASVLAYYLFKRIWNHWIVWLLASLVIYSLCRSFIQLVSQALSIALFTIFRSCPIKIATQVYLQMEEDSNRVSKDGLSQ